jgi:hypothetical protein
MNKYILILLLLVSCKNYSQEDKNPINIKNAYNSKNEIEYLNQFPNKFEMLNEYFGWNDSLDKPNILYNDANKYIDYWFSLILRNEYREYEKNIINICYGGKWDADGINYFQDKSIEYLIKNKRMELLNSLSTKEAKSVLFFLFDSPHPDINSELFLKLNAKNKSIVKDLFTNELKGDVDVKDNITFYEKNSDYIITALDINGDKILDKIVSSTPYKGNELILFLGDGNNYVLSIKTINFSEDGGNIVYEIVNNPNTEKGLLIKTKFPDRGFSENDYFIVNENKSWILKNIIYKTLSDQSKNAIEYNCDVPQNINLKETNIEEKLVPIPDEGDRNKKCTTKISISKNYFIRDPDGYTNLRKDKNGTSDIIEKVKSGEKIEVLDNSGNWWLIQTKSGKKGYVYKTKIKSE